MAFESLKKVFLPDFIHTFSEFDLHVPTKKLPSIAKSSKFTKSLCLARKKVEKQVFR